LGRHINQPSPRKATRVEIRAFATIQLDQRRLLSEGASLHFTRGARMIW
jgi:hypothetical protein